MQIDLHYYGTYTIARTAGLTEKASRIIAYASQYVDDSIADDVNEHNDGSKVIAIPTAHHPSDLRNIDKDHQRYIWVPFHFLPGGIGDSFTQKLICRQDSKIARELVNHNISQTNKPFILELVGITAHVYADTFAHYGFSGVSSRRNRVDGSSIKIENPSALIQQMLGNKLSDFFKKYGDQGGLIRNIRSLISGATEIVSGALGHGAVSIYPDQPYLKWSFNYEFPELSLKSKSIRNNQKTYLKAAEALYIMFIKFGDLNPSYRDNDPVPFEKISNVLKDLFSYEASKNDRIARWQHDVIQNKFYKSNGKPIPIYNHEVWETQHHSFVNMKHSKNITKTNIYRFYQAASYHRHYVLRELLPNYGLIVI